MVGYTSRASISLTWYHKSKDITISKNKSCVSACLIKSHKWPDSGRQLIRDTTLNISNNIVSSRNQGQKPDPRYGLSGSKYIVSQRYHRLVAKISNHHAMMYHRVCISVDYSVPYRVFRRQDDTPKYVREHYLQYTTTWTSTYNLTVWASRR